MHPVGSVSLENLTNTVKMKLLFNSQTIQFSLVAQLCPTLCDPMDYMFKTCLGSH